MRAIRRFLARLSSLTKRREIEARLRAEIEEHLARQTADNIRAGMSPAEARRRAALKFGAVEAAKEAWRDERGMPVVEILIQDTRLAVRRLRNTPAFTGAAVLTLALGIGATTSIFTLVYAVLMKSLAVAKPGELYRLGKEPRCCYWGGYSQSNEFSLVSFDLYKHFRDNTNAFAELAAFSASTPRLGVRRSGQGETAQSYPGEFVSGNYFVMFGVRAYAGRALMPGDDRPGAAPVAVMSYRLWQQSYGSDPSVIGGVFDLNERPVTVVGVTPPGFFGDTLRNNPPDFFLPLRTEPYVQRDQDLYTPNNNWLSLIGRIRPGVSIASTEARMRVQMKQWLRSHWGDMSADERALFPEQTLFLRPGGAGITSMRKDYESWLQILMSVTALVLLIVCANIANLMLVRGMERRRQTSLSMALGAQPGRVATQALTESILLSLAGGVAGLAIAFAGTRLILKFVFPQVGGMAGVPIDASPSAPVLLFAFGVSLITGLAFGIAPAWMGARVNPMEALRGSGRSAVRIASAPRKTLVVVQTALSLVLLSASGLLTAALHNLEHQDFGFDQSRRIVARIDASVAGYTADRLTPLYQRIRDSLTNIPGVSSAALAIYSPMSGNNWGSSVVIDGRRTPGPHDDTVAFWDRVTADYFDAVGNPIVRGRAISRQDTAESPHVAVVDEAFARKFFGNEDPIGKHFGQAGPGSEREYKIVGIAKDARYLTFDLDKPVTPFFFLPEAQHDFSQHTGKERSPGSHNLHDIVIVTKPGATLPEAKIRAALGRVDPNLPVISIRSLEDQISGQFRQQRLMARLTSFFGLLSLLLSSIGIYGVTAWNAGRRTSEIGVRVAVGAGRADVIALVLRGAFGLLIAGLVAGLPLTFAAGRFLGHQLYGISPYDPGGTLISVLALGSSAFVASLIPALRASLISPVEALRME